MPDVFCSADARWPLHDIAIANIVWCMAFKGGVGGGACIAQWSCNSIELGYALQVGGVNKRMMDSHDRIYREIISCKGQDAPWLDGITPRSVSSHDGIRQLSFRIY